MSNEIANFLLLNGIKTFFASAALTVIICFLVNMLVMPFMRKKLISKALQAGHYVSANKIKTQYDLGSTDSMTSRETICTYQYEVNGRKYIYKRWASYMNQPETLTLYYSKNPAKAKEEQKFGYIGWNGVILFPGIFCILFIIFCLK